MAIHRVAAPSHHPDSLWIVTAVGVNAAVGLFALTMAIFAASIPR